MPGAETDSAASCLTDNPFFNQDKCAREGQDNCQKVKSHCCLTRLLTGKQTNQKEHFHLELNVSMNTDFNNVQHLTRAP